MKSFVAGMVLLLATWVFVPVAGAQQWARDSVEKSPRHREWVQVKYGNRTVDTFVVYPERKDKAPVIVMIHTIAGFIDWIESAADQLAAEGYIVVAPDLLSQMSPTGGRSNTYPEGGAREGMGKLSKDQVTADLNAVADYGLKLPASNGKLMVTGFCSGGNETFRFATNRPDLQAAFVFYGTQPDKEAIARIKAPIYAFYGGADARVNATIPSTIENMKEAGKVYEPMTYDGAGHGFMQGGEDPAGTDPNKKARLDAWARWRTLLKKHQ
ncbi:MAG: dienelactone hydrolase family protein [Acidobacteria bacterium]|nr:dienelactone hydrolase family protein [Acidobacteriota bacterium]